jgi:hypothetical protein
MPNWCYNDLRVSGPAEDLAQFQKQARGVLPRKPTKNQPAPEVFSFQNLLPVPAELSGADSRAAAHEWRLQHWGCRSDTLGSEQAGTTRDGGVLYRFETPWSPPVPFVREVSAQWPTLVFLLDYEEQLAGFRGLARAAAGSWQHFCLNL